MPFPISPTVVWGIAAGAAALLVMLGAFTIFLCRRMRQKKKLTRILAASERRLSGYPGGHFSLTDADVARMPGTRSVLRRPTYSSRGSSRGYVPVTSRESLPSRPILASMSRAVVRDQAVPQNTNSSPSWPLPRRLTRSNVTPLVKLRTPPLTPITEKSAKKLGRDRAVAIEIQPIGVDKHNDKIQMPVLDSQESFKSDVFTTTVLTPKPLFHDKPRSCSAGAISQCSKAQVGEATVSNRKKALPSTGFPRSSSLCSQQPGLAPEKPMPPLPFNLPVPKRIQSFKSPGELSSRRTSENSLFSGDTYILDDKAFRPFSRADTDFTSISLASPSMVESKSEGLGIFAGDDVDLQTSKIGETSSLGLPVKAIRPHAQAGSRKSLRASIVNSLPRSESSGLSMSLLDHGPSRKTSSASLSTGTAMLSNRSSLGVPGNTNRKHATLRGISPASPLRTISVCGNNEDIKSKRVSTSILQVVSGNNGSPLHDRVDKRPSSWSTTNPFPWDSTTSMRPGKPSAVKDRSKGHRPQRPTSISNNQPRLMQIMSLPHTGAIEAASSNTSSLTPSLDLSKNDYFLPRPPSRVTFDPQINPSLKMKSFHSIGVASYSPTLSMVDMYNSGANSAPELEEPTAERKPSAQGPSGANPNRHKQVVSHDDPGRWSVLAPDMEFTLPTPEELDSSRPSQLPENSMSSFNSRPFLFPMPPPSRPSYYANRRSPSSSPIRGPRAPPARHYPSKRISKSLHNGSGKDLRKSIMAIRRMNSEAAELQPKQHQRYLSIGRTGSTIFEGDVLGDIFGDVQVLGGKAEEVEKHLAAGKGLKNMPSTYVAGDCDLSTPTKKKVVGLPWGSPGSLYDTSGFLREG
ncbi:hypothetical protein MMC22_004657 [Lobaria immixta]|nr:hypothetical protein [Lobaria immixta]